MPQTPRSAPASAWSRLTTQTKPVLSYRDNAGEGPPVVFLHGVGSSAATWDQLFARLPARYRLIAADLRGHGRSQPVAGPATLDDFVGDHFRLLDELELASVHVVGFSLGALIGEAIALARPELTSSLTLLNCIGGRTETERKRAAERLEVIRTTPPARVAAASAGRWFTGQFAASSPDLVAAEIAIVSSVDSPSYAAAYEVLADNDLISAVSAISCPVLIATGADDVGSTPRMSSDIHARIGGSRLQIIQGVKHYAHIEAAATVASLICGFLDDVQRAPSKAGPLSKEEG